MKTVLLKYSYALSVNKREISMTNHCIVVGGGVIGLLSAWELIQSGWSVTVLEKGKTGKESSWAGGGILSPLYPWREQDAINALALYGQQQYPHITKKLLSETGMDSEWIQSGMLFLDVEDAEEASHWLATHHISFEWKTHTTTAVPPSVVQAEANALLIPSIAQLRPPRFMSALKHFLLQAGVKIIEDTSVGEILIQDHRYAGVITEQGMLHSDCVLITAGAWSQPLLKPLRIQSGIEPVRGQIIAFQSDGNLLSHIMIQNSFYLIPRRDGLIVAGSTVEHTGFDKNTTEEAAMVIKEAAYKMLPELKSLPITHHWAGLRPWSPRGIPYICAHPKIKHVFINAGHFRNGLTLAPGSAKLIVDIIEDRQPFTGTALYAVDGG